MRKINAFGCVVLVMASMFVFSLVNVPTEAITYPPTFTEFYKNQEDYPNLEIVNLECLNCYVSHHYIGSGSYGQYAIDVSGTIKNTNNAKVIRIRIMIDILTQTGVKSIRHESNRDMNPGETTPLNLGSGTKSLPIDLKNIEVLGLMETPSPTPKKTPTPVVTPSPIPKKTPTPVVTPKVEPKTIIDTDGDGVPDVSDYNPHDPNIRTKSDFVVFWSMTIVIIAAIFAVGYFVIRRWC